MIRKFLINFVKNNLGDYFYFTCFSNQILINKKLQ